MLAPLGVYYQTNFWPLAFWCRHVMFFDQGDLFSVCFNFWPNRFLWATIVLCPTTNHSWTQEINGIYSGKENLLLIWSHKSWLGILIKINFKIKKRFSWLVFATSWKEFEVFHCFEISYLFSLENDLEAIVFFFTPVLIFDARFSGHMTLYLLLWDIHSCAVQCVRKCFYEKSKVVLQCSKAEKSCVEIKDAAKKSGDFDVPCSNILLRNQLSRTFLQKLKFFFKPIKSQKMVNFALIMRKKWQIHD